MITTLREQELERALHDAIMQLEGWIAWKCPKRHREEHEANLHRLRCIADPSIKSNVPENLRVVEVKVRQSGGTYITNTVNKQRASCTHSAQQAVQVLAGKLFDSKADAIVITRGQKPDSHLTPETWFIEALLGELLKPRKMAKATQGAAR